MTYLFWCAAGYLSGSVLYAYLIPKQFCHVDIRTLSDDGNPGTANAFKYAGFFCRKQCDPLRTVKGLSARFSGGPHAGSGKASLCLRDSCTCGRTCLFCFFQRKRRQSNRRLLWCHTGFISRAVSFSSSGFLLYSVFHAGGHKTTSDPFCGDFCSFCADRIQKGFHSFHPAWLSFDLHHYHFQAPYSLSKRGDPGILRFSQALILQSCVTRAFFSIRSSSRSIQLKMLCSLTCPISFSSSTKLTSSTSLFCRVSFSTQTGCSYT